MRLCGLAWRAGTRQRRVPELPKRARESNWRVVEVVVPGSVSRVHEARRVLASMLATLIGGSLCGANKTAQQPREQHLTFDEGNREERELPGATGIGNGEFARPGAPFPSHGAPGCGRSGDPANSGSGQGGK